MKNKTLTIMFADIQGYTSRSAQQSREEIELFITEIKQLVQSCVKKRNGNLVKTMGDGFLVTFESPTDAVICGIEIQRTIEQTNAFISEKRKRIGLRIGINTGEVNVDTEGDIYGNAVNIAAKIQQSASPNKVFISETTYLAMNESEIKTLNLETVKAKGILKRVKLYKILNELERNKALPEKDSFKQKSAAPSNNLRFLLLITIILLSAILLYDKSGKLTFVNKVAKKENISSCKIEGIIHSGKNPSVMIGRNAYFVGSYVCGNKIKGIYRDSIIVDFRGTEKTYKIGEVIEEPFISR